MPQYYSTHCLICNCVQIAATEHVICNTCANPDIDTVPEYVYKTQRQLAALQAVAEAAVEARDLLRTGLAPDAFGMTAEQWAQHKTNKAARILSAALTAYEAAKAKG